MHRTSTKFIFCLLILAAFSITNAFAQTITIGTIDPGPYAPGSTIAIPFHVSDAGACMGQSNTFGLFVSDASGNFSATPTATINGFYAAFFNYTVPAGAAPGTGYKVMVTANNPAISSAASNAITIVAGTGVKAAVSSASINSEHLEVFGMCNGKAGNSYTFTNASDPGTTVTASFLNESTQNVDVSNQDITSNSYSFTAAATNYAVIIKATNGASVSTKAYELINNVVNVSIGSTGSTSVCLTGGSAVLTYNVDISSPNGIQFNYPANAYTVTWGDGAQNIYTLCEIIANGGHITHQYTQPSCGKTANNHFNSYEIDFQAQSPYCGNVGAAPSNYAQVFQQPTNAFQFPATACTNTPVTFNNESSPGPDPNATSSNCINNPNALYTWSVDGHVIKQNVPLGQTFVYTFTTNGKHQITLHLQNSPTDCVPTDAVQEICIQNPPQPIFSVPAAPVCINAGPVTPTNSSVIDANCDVNNSYLWAVSGPGTVSYAGGTSATSQSPQFTFSKPGVYAVNLTINTASCGPVTSPSQNITVNDVPTAALSADFSVCGQGLTYTFDNTAGSPTKTTYTGDATPASATYTWTVTGGNYTLAGGTTLTSQYPQFTFSDYATYTVTVTQTNNCGTSNTATQHISFQQSPTVSAGPAPISICQGTAAQLAGSVQGNGVTSIQWTGGAGTFSDVTSPTSTYTPSAAEIAAGHVTLTLKVVTSLPAPCNVITSTVTINITPTDVVTSASTRNYCSGSPVNYNITASNAGSTFTWTAALTSGSASGFNNGSGATINDVITSNDPTTDAVITYTITPTSNGCAGTPFNFTAKILAVPVLTMTPANNTTICGGNPAGIGFTSTIANTTYTWTSTTTGGVTGATNQATQVNTSGIQDIINNPTTAVGSVTYTVTPYNATGCAGTPVSITLNVQPQPVTSNPGTSQPVCNVTTYTLQGNNPAPGTGMWTLKSGPAVTFDDPTKPNAVVSGLIPGNIYQFTWTITAVPGCSSANTVTITDVLPTVGGTTSGAATVCSGGDGGNITLSGQTGDVISWESSTDNGATWTAIPNTTTTLPYPSLTQTTQYRADVRNTASCNIEYSAVTTITVNPPTPVAAAGSDQPTLCNVTSATLAGNDPGAFQGMWTQPAGQNAVITDPTKYNTTVTGLQGGNIYTFTWTIKGIAPCPDTQDQVTLTDHADVVTSFTKSSGILCGTDHVTFTNTSTNQTGATFQWNFGDGSPSTNAMNPTHTFQESGNGKDTTYYIQLTVADNCVPRPPFVDSVTVRPSVPVAAINPNQTNWCYPVNLIVENKSPGNNQSYTFYLLNPDGTNFQPPQTYTDKTSAKFSFTGTTKVNLTLYMVATGFCGQSAQTFPSIYITASPPDYIAGVQVQKPDLSAIVTSGCAPVATALVNTSTGGDNLTYYIYAADKTTRVDSLFSNSSVKDIPYIFTNPGTFYVQVVAHSFCGDVPSDLQQVVVYPVPVAAFHTDTYSNCKDASVQFRNDTPVDPRFPVSFKWDFGDGSPQSSETEPKHSYHYTNSPYTVTLIATNSDGCPDTIKKTAYITVNGPPNTQFTARPGLVTKIPNYTFSFIDQTTGGPVTWVWDFGDKTAQSPAQNPVHTYADTGKYVVSLTTTNALGCDSTTTQTVYVTGVPGQLYLPNAFMPSSATTELQKFMAKGSGIATWHLQIFNTYGEQVFETTKLTEKGEPVEGWDGTYKGQPAPQGVYVWQCSATFINGTQWKGMSYDNSPPKRTGSVNLIR